MSSEINKTSFVQTVINSVSKMCIKRFTAFDVRNDIFKKFTRHKNNTSDVYK